MDLGNIQGAIHAGRFFAGPHAVHAAVADGLSLQMIWAALLHMTTAIIEDYPLDPRGPSCLIYCEVDRLPEHVVLAYPATTAAQRTGLPSLAFMITCYRPGGPQYAGQWSADFKQRIP